MAEADCSSDVGVVAETADDCVTMTTMMLMMMMMMTWVCV